MQTKQSIIFNRDDLIAQLEKVKLWDFIIIGGGATGLGIAVDAASRGYKTLLLEQSDFAKGTSSRSTKLIHGGVRYLAQGDISLVYEALQERGLLMKNAPHIVHRQSFIIPCYTHFDEWKYLMGLKLYDWLSGRLSLGGSRWLTKEEVSQRLPFINSHSLIGGVEYFDGQFDDARLAVNLVQTAIEQGAVVLNYCKVVHLLKENKKVGGVIARDEEKNKEYHLQAKAVVNATGVFVDDILKMDIPERNELVRPSQGVHIVIDRSFLKSNSALMIPQTSDGRVLFAVPWNGYVLAGTTDTPLEKTSLEPVAQNAEIEFILQTLQQYIINGPQREDILSVFAGLRPLAAPQKNKATKSISRSHKIIIGDSGLITITGGKWTTYRKMAEATVNAAIKTAPLTPSVCKTKNLKIHGHISRKAGNTLSLYGSDTTHIDALIEQYPSLSIKLTEGLPYTEAEAIWAVRNEMARTVEDILARRTRILFLDAKAAIAAAPRVAAIMAGELQKSEAWQNEQLKAFYETAQHYVIKDSPVKTSVLYT